MTHFEKNALERKIKVKNLIDTLSNLRGISGFEYKISDYVAELFSPFADEIKTDALGNVIAVRKCNKKNAKKIMIEAHMDEIGLMISKIDDHGFLKFVPVGGIDPETLPSAEVIVHGKKDILGVIGAKPPHLLDKGEEEKCFKISDMTIDVGMTKKEIEEYVTIGDPVTFSQSVGELKGGKYSGKTLDDRAGVAALVTMMKNLAKIKLDVDVYAVAAVQEEVGLRGAKVAAYSVNPDIAIAIDVCHGITPDNSYNAFELGEGVVVTVGPNIHPKLFKRLLETAEKYNIKTQIDADGGDTGTDAWAIQVSRYGVPTALLSIPLKYMHTSVETLSISDVEKTAELLVRFIENLDDEMEEWLCL